MLIKSLRLNRKVAQRIGDLVCNLRCQLVGHDKGRALVFSFEDHVADLFILVGVEGEDVSQLNLLRGNLFFQVVDLVLEPLFLVASLLPLVLQELLQLVQALL